MSSPHRRTTLVIALVLVTSFNEESRAQDTKKGPTAAEILAKVSQTYSACRSYSDEGTGRVAQGSCPPRGRVRR
jgi:hypothetical protein